MLHERRLIASHEFQESTVSKSASVRHDIHTHWYTHPHQSRLQVSRKCDRLSVRSTCVVCLFVRDLAHSLYLAESFLSLSLLHAFVHFHWRGPGAEGSLMRLFDRGMGSVKPRYMCALHVPGRALPYWYTFYAKYGARGAEGWRDWRMKHMDNRRGSPWLLARWRAALRADGKHRQYAKQQASAKFKAHVPKETVNSQLDFWHTENLRLGAETHQCSRKWRLIHFIYLFKKKKTYLVISARVTISLHLKKIS